MPAARRRWLVRCSGRAHWALPGARTCRIADNSSRAPRAEAPGGGGVRYCTWHPFPIPRASAPEDVTGAWHTLLAAIPVSEV
jgi:hypothetical protein